jgi:hypothetical protein
MNTEHILVHLALKLWIQLTAPTTARKQAAARMPGKAYETRKTRAAQVTATREHAAADEEVCAPQKNDKTSVTYSRSAA